MIIKIIDSKKCEVVLSYLDSFEFKTSESNCGIIANYRKDCDLVLSVEHIGNSCFVKYNNNGLYIGFWVSDWTAKDVNNIRYKGEEHEEL